MSKSVLMKEYKELAKEKWVKIEVRTYQIATFGAQLTTLQLDEEDIYNWNVALIVINPDSLYYGGYLRAKMAFPKDYPYSPPGMLHSYLAVVPALKPSRLPLPDFAASP